MTQYGPEFFRKFADIITEAETVQLDEGIVDSLKATMAKVKAIPGVQKYMQAAEAKKAQLIQAAQNSSNGKELLANIKQAMGGQQSVAEGIVGGAFVGGLGGGLLAMASEVFMQAYMAMGKPSLTAMAADHAWGASQLAPGTVGGHNTLLLVGFLVLMGACAIATGVIHALDDR